MNSLGYKLVSASIVAPSSSFSSMEANGDFNGSLRISQRAYNVWVDGMINVSAKANASENTSAAITLLADLPTAMGVGAIGENGRILFSSNWGARVKVVAPGTDIWAPLMGGGYTTFQNTSAATPLVSGTISLIQAANPELLADEVEGILYQTATDVIFQPSSPGYDIYTGYGVVNAGAAVEMAATKVVWRSSSTTVGTPTLVEGPHDRRFFNYYGFNGGLKSGLYYGVSRYKVAHEFDYAFGHDSLRGVIRLRSTVGWPLDDHADSTREISWAAFDTLNLDRNSVTVYTGAYYIPDDGLNSTASIGWWPCKNPPCETEPYIDLHMSLLVTTTPGDANNSASVTIGDVNFILDWIYTSGPTPPILNDADADGQCTVNIGDVSYLVSYIFASGPAPVNADCVANSLKLVPGDNFVVTEDVALAVGATENSKRPVMLNASRKLHALGLTLRALNGSKLQVTNRLDGVQMHWSQLGDMVKIGLLDIYGERFITPADTNLIDIEGDFEIVAIEATDILSDGTTEYMRPEFVAGKFTSGSDASIKEVSLDGIHPNPFNPITSIAFSLPHSANVRIEIFNLLGQKVTTLVDRSFDAGSHKVQWNSEDKSGSKVASGIYFAKMISGDYTASKKMVILK